ncbi:DUF3472 domain-containing protein [Stieleria sp. JC731]|uniref:DUF3472 domain-containing protein n=1 Tax=Pirellulaceae TaxID=2691357 RepID=UPI001E31C45A|nr:DUF3472 domain-containing protein [Stieleria sp. JC731]MCC9603130.1 DUF3472 domain-containing protein [Stieleria sp. JC731]
MIRYCLAPLWLALLLNLSHADEWTVPLAGNAFQTATDFNDRGIRRDGSLNLKDPKVVYSAFFHVDRPASLDLKITASSKAAGVKMITSVGGKRFETEVGPTQEIYPIGNVDVDHAGYVRVDFQLADVAGPSALELGDLMVASDTTGLEVDFVKNNDGNMFYWGRRGPSVHLRYVVPKDRNLQYAYSEVTVPVGQDTLGSYFMANGFGEGYFGFQVNGSNERRVLFSVWSPFKTDRPSDIPEDQRVKLLARGDGVRVGEFGNEGSGGQSYLIEPWKSGVTYCFLTEVKPDGNGSTVYTSWFCEKEKPWRLIASFSRPKTDTTLRGFHSFLENFMPATGFIERRGLYGNTWVCDESGQWHECTSAIFSVDATGAGKHRLDFDGGAEGSHFFMRNCGFFDRTGRPGKTFKRESTSDQKPNIEFAELPLNSSE